MSISQLLKNAQQIFGLAAIALLSLICPASGDDLSYLEGAWTPVTGPNIGAPFWFNKAFAGYDAYIPWWGQTSILESDGKFGSHIKIVGSKDGNNVSCFYYVIKLGRVKMTWNKRDGDNSACPESLMFQRRESQSAEDSTTRGNKYLANKDFDTAIAEYNAAIREDESYAPAYAARARARYRKEQYDAAIADASEAIRLNPASSAHHNLRGYIYHLKESYDLAITDYSEAIRLSPQFSYQFCNRANSYVKKDLLESAERDYSECLRLDPKSETAARNLSDVKKKLSLVEFQTCNRTNHRLWVTILGSKESDNGDFTYSSEDDRLAGFSGL